MTEAQAFFTGDRVKFMDGHRNDYKTGTVVGNIFWGISDYEDDPDSYVCQKFLVLQDETETVHEISACGLTHVEAA